MSESSKVKAWAVKNGVKLETFLTLEKKGLVVRMEAPNGKCFVTSDDHVYRAEAIKAGEAWKLALAAIKQGIEDCPVVCTCRNTSVPRLNEATATVTHPLPRFTALTNNLIVTMNREGWLTALADKLRPVLFEAGATVPASLRVACGWPSKGAFSSKTRTIGECWAKEASGDRTTEIFISPFVSTGLEAGAVLVHELVHASGQMGHGKGFKQIALAVGLEGRMKATTPSEALKARLNALIAEIGAYPHATLDKNQRPGKKDGTRLLKVVCPSPDCGYVIRTTQKWVDLGFPTCVCGELMTLAEGNEPKKEPN